jgi:arginyl-tRNA synthetase
MGDLTAILLERLRVGFDSVLAGADPGLRPSARADFQANGALALAKRLQRDPKEVANEVLEAARLEDICADAHVSGPGFINLTLADRFVAERLGDLGADSRLGVPVAGEPQIVVVDYSAPNVAKEMHVGHLRSTIIGDALCRILAFTGNTVVRENHVGDWGTPFGMLIEHLLDIGEEKAVHELSVGDLDSFYRQARMSFDSDDSFRERSRRRVVLLQHNDPETIRLWRILVDRSIGYFDEVYSQLGVLLTDDDIVAESYYNDMLPAVVDDLAALGLLVESEGALCVFPPGFTNRDGSPLPLIVQKSDEGFGYAATDLAAIRDRVGRVGASCILYVVGAEQSQHLQMCFEVARMAGWLPDGVSAVHVAHGLVLGTDRKKLKSRSGEPIKLVDLLDEAIDRAEAAVAERNPDIDPSARREEAKAVGIGAVKYADLSTERTRDYVFDAQRMVAFEGDTGPYLQYAHARIRSIFRRGNVELPGTTLVPELRAPAERALALELLGFPDSVPATLEHFSPSSMCAYLFGLSSAFTTFYETCPVLNSEGDTRRSRLLLCDLTARVLELGLQLLGIEAPDQM